MTGRYIGMKKDTSFKILLMDDMETRQAMELGEENLTRIESMEHVSLVHGYDYVPGAIASSGYALLAFHAGFLKDNSWTEAVLKEAVAASKYVILFGGSIAVAKLSRSGYVLRINSSDFYSDRSVDFLASLRNAGEEYRGHLLLRYLYGRDWYMPFLFRYRQLVWSERRDSESLALLAEAGKVLKEVSVSPDDIGNVIDNYVGRV